MEGSVGVLRQVQVRFRFVVMAADTLFHDGRGLPLILHDNLRSRAQNKAGGCRKSALIKTLSYLVFCGVVVDLGHGAKRRPELVHGRGRREGLTGDRIF